MPATSPINRETFIRQAMQQAERFGLVLRLDNGAPGPAYSEDEVYGGPANANGNGIAAITANYSPGVSVLSFAANPLRILLIIENLTTTPIAVGFGVTASVAKGQGHILTTKGSLLYMDRKVPTNNFYVDANGSSFAVTQGTPAAQ